MRNTTLANGFKITAHEVVAETFYNIKLAIEAGACHDSDDKSGRAHVNEHLAFAGTTARSFEKINFDIQARGGSFGASTSYEQTVYNISIPAKSGSQDNLSLALDILSDVIQNSTYPENRIAHEQGVIVNELGQRRDEIDMKLGEALVANAYPNQAYGRSIGGSRDIVSSLTRNDILEFVNKFYRGGNMSLAITGPAPTDLLIDEASKYFSSIIEGQTPELEPPKFQAGENRIDTDKWLNQVYTSVSMPFAYGSFEENEILRYMFTQTMWHQIYIKLRESSNLSYGAVTQLNQLKKGGIFTIRGCTNPDTADAFLDSIASTFRTAFHLGDVPEEIFEGIKINLLAFYERLPTQGSDLCDELLYYLRKPGGEFDREGIIRQIKAVTLGDIKNYIPQAVDPKQLSFLSMGPRTDFMPYGKICSMFKVTQEPIFSGPTPPALP